MCIKLIETIKKKKGTIKKTTGKLYQTDRTENPMLFLFILLAPNSQMGPENWKLSNHERENEGQPTSHMKDPTSLLCKHHITKYCFPSV